METMTINDVSKLLHVTDDTARNRLAAGSEMPPSFRVGRRRLFLRSEVERWLIERAGHRADSAQSPTAHESKAD